MCVLLRQEIAFGVQRRVASPEVLLLSLFLFYVFNKILRIGNAVQYEISPIVFSDNYIGFYVTYIIRKTMGLGFSKRWVLFHKTTRIFFEGFSFPLFLCLSDSVFLFVFFFFSWFCLVVVVLCVLLLLISIGGMAIWIRFPKCRLQCLFFISLME